MANDGGVDEYYFLIDVISIIQGKRIGDSFSDVFTSPGYPNFGEPRHALAWASTHKPDDTDGITLLRLFLYYVLIHKGRDLHPTQFVEPETHYHDSMLFKPQVQLVFYENKIDALNADRRPLRSQISLRLMDVTSTSITEMYVNSLIQRIWDTLVIPTPYSFNKGKILGYYRDKDNGIEFKIFSNSEENIKAIIEKIILIQNLEINLDYLTISESKREYPTPEETIVVLGDTYQKPIQRAETTVHFVKAELKLLGMRASKLLLCRSDYVDAKCENVF